MLACMLMVGMGAWAEDETLTISGASTGNNAPWGTGYDDGSGNSTTSESTSIGITYKQTARMSTAIQIAKNAANGFYSTTVPTNKVIKSVNIVSKTNSVNLHMSTDGTNWTSADNISSTTTRNYTVNNAYKYFKVTATSSYAQITSITVTYMSDGSDKTALATPTNLSATNITDKSATLSWDAVDGASDYTVEYKTAEGNWNEVSPTPTTNSCNISGLNYNTNYNWRVTANPTNTTTYKSSLSASDSFKTLDFIISAGTYNVLPNNVFWGNSSQDGSKSVTANTVFGPVTEYGMTFEMNSNTSTNSYMKSDHCRAYNGYTLTITAPTGYNLTAINFTGTTWAAPTASVGTMNSKSWTGSANEVTFTFSGTSYISNIQLTYAPVITISSVGYATYYNADKYEMPDGLQGEIIVANGANLSAKVVYEEGDVVPANTPLLIKGSEGIHAIPAVNAEPSDASLDGNLLHGTLTAGMTTGGNNSPKYYKLGYKGGNLGWYWGAAEGAAFQIEANKAYLVIESNSVKSFISFDDDTDAIHAVESAAPKAIYDLQGRMVRNAQKGMYIINGKKVVK